MKTQHVFALICLLLSLSSCKKEQVTRVVEFPSTTYSFLGTYDSSGKPAYLTTPDAITPGLLAFIDSTLVDANNLTVSHPELFTSSAIADLNITLTSDVYVTFVTEGAGFTNSIAFYTYPTNNPPQGPDDIKTITYVFPNAGHLTPLHPGDRVKIGRFDAGTSVGFLILEDGWDVTHSSLNDKVVHFCSDDVLNPEIDPKLKRHAVLLNYTPENKVLISFEDTDRTKPECDNDFNDVVIYCTVQP